MSIRKIAGIVLALTLAAGLAGCTVRAKTAAKLIGGEFTFVSCDDFVFDTITIGTHDFSHWEDGYVEGWSASGGGTLAAGEHLTYGTLPDGFHSETGPKSLPLDHQQIQVVLYYSPISEPSSEIRGTFDSRELSAKYWLRGDGTQNAKPCD